MYMYRKQSEIWMMWADRLVFSHSERDLTRDRTSVGRWAQEIAAGNHDARVLRLWYRFLPRVLAPRDYQQTVVGP